MNECTRCGATKNIIHSGTDGLYLGVLDELHKICYDCGNAHMLKEQKVNE